MVDPNALVGDWIHVTEEDSPTEMVFRRKSSESARGRGRLGIRLDRGAACAVSSIGRGDRQNLTAGSWSFDPTQATLELELSDGTREQLKIVSASADTLRVQKQP
jgi:hypothetical protein